MTMSNTRDGERTLARRVFMILAAMSLATLALAVTGSADQHDEAPDASVQIAMAPTRGPLVSRSALTSSGGTKLFHSVAGGKAFHLTQACVENTAMEIEIKSASGTFSVGTRGCHSFHPAYVVDGAATFHCKNRSGLQRSCTITGHTVGDVAAGRRAVFIDVGD
ncbi:MAG: hypothetical protein V3R77_02690 [Candidatus Binatia bacterium]